MKVTLDQAKCQGHGRCAILASAVFDIDDLGKGVVLVDEVPPSEENDTRDAVFSCPESAIALIDE